MSVSPSQKKKNIWVFPLHFGHFLKSKKSQKPCHLKNDKDVFRRKRMKLAILLVTCWVQFLPLVKDSNQPTENTPIRKRKIIFQTSPFLSDSSREFEKTSKSHRGSLHLWQFQMFIRRWCQCGTRQVGLLGLGVAAKRPCHSTDFGVVFHPSYPRYFWAIYRGL